MTAHSLNLTRDGLVSALTNAERSPSEGRRRLIAAIAVYQNEDCQTRESAIEAYLDGHPAFWTTARHSDQRASNLVLAINYGATIMGALGHWYPPHAPIGRDQALDTLVPLNHAAAVELVDAYAAYGLMRDAEELEMRRTRDMRKPRQATQPSALPPDDEPGWDYHDGSLQERERPHLVSSVGQWAAEANRRG